MQVVLLDMVRRAMLLNALVTGNKDLAARHAHMLQCVLKLATSAPPQAAAAVRLPHILVNLNHATSTSAGGALLVVELHLADSLGAAQVGEAVEEAGAVGEAVETTLKQCAALLGRDGDAQPAHTDTRTARCTRFVMSARCRPLCVILRNAPALGRLGVRAVTVRELTSFSSPVPPLSSSAPSARERVPTRLNARERTTAGGAASWPEGWREWSLQAASGESAAPDSEYANWPVAYVGPQNAHVFALLDHLVSSSDAAKICSLEDIGAHCSHVSCIHRSYYTFINRLNMKYDSM